MQGFHCTFALGTFVAPWIAKPFISLIEKAQDNRTDAEPKTTESHLVASRNDTKYLPDGEFSTYTTQFKFSSANPTDASIQNTTTNFNGMSVLQLHEWQQSESQYRFSCVESVMSEKCNSEYLNYVFWLHKGLF